LSLPIGSDARRKAHEGEVPAQPSRSCVPEAGRLAAGPEYIFAGEGALDEKNALMSDPPIDGMSCHLRRLEP
jgi:hypothetical protein